MTVGSGAVVSMQSIQMVMVYLKYVHCCGAMIASKCVHPNNCLIFALFFQVYCDMETDGGGWTVFQRRQDGSGYFYRSWAAYERGFGSLKREFWLGLDKIHPLTTASGDSQLNTLRIDLGDHEGNKGYAMYSTFKVLDSSTKYRLNIGGYSSGSVNVGNGMAGCNGMKFTTRDSDNDLYSSNCAEGHGGTMDVVMQISMVSMAQAAMLQLALYGLNGKAGNIPSSLQR